jgi:hypothetical protein
LRDADIVKKLVEGFKEHNMSPVALDSGENSSTVIRFEGTNESDCSLSVITAAGRIVIQRIIGTSAIAQDFHYKEIDKDFFELIRDHYATIKGLIKMRDGLLGKM